MIKEILNIIFTENLALKINLGLAILIKVLVLVLAGLVLVYLLFKLKELFWQQREESELVSEFKRASRELAEIERTKSEFISIITHELKTPISQIAGNISIILEQKDKIPQDFVPILENAFSGTRRMSELISALIKASKIKSEVIKTSLKPLGVVKEVISKFETPANKKGLKIFFEPPSKIPLPSIKIASSDLEELLSILLDNAIKFTLKGEITVRIKEKDDNLLFEIQDTGIGIPKKDLTRVFEKFYKVDTSHLHFTFEQTGGIGLGLYIAKTIVDLYGGKIWAESEGEGKGSKFSFTLPRAE